MNFHDIAVCCVQNMNLSYSVQFLAYFEVLNQCDLRFGGDCEECCCLLRCVASQSDINLQTFLRNVCYFDMKLEAEYIPETLPTLYHTTPLDMSVDGILLFKIWLPFTRP